MFLGWVPNVAYLHWALSLVTTAEFNMQYCATPTICAEWAALVSAIFVDPTAATEYASILVGYFVGFRSLAVLLLAWRGRRLLEFGEI